MALLVAPTEQSPEAYEAESLSAFFNVLGLSNTISKIRAQAGLLRSSSRLKDVAPLHDDLQENVAAIETGLSNTTGTVALDVPRVHDRYSRLPRLLPDFSASQAQDANGIYRLWIPTGNITGVQALPYQYSEIEYDPVVSLRVQTYQDKQTDETTPGQWHRFALLHVNLELFPE